jgi:sugar transferase (PEP-CTERM/EpsH1 system associated)
MPNVSNVRDIQPPAPKASMNQRDVKSMGGVRSDGDSRGQRKRVLFLTHRVPYPPDRGDRIRGFHILQTLSKHFDVSLATVSDEPVTDEQWQVMDGLADRVAVQRINAKWGKIRGLTALALGGAVTPAYFYRRPLAKTIARWNAMQPFDAVVTLCTGMIDYARGIIGSAVRTISVHDESGGPHSGPYHILDLVDVDSAKWAEYALNSGGPMRWVYAAESKRLRRIEAGEQDRLDAVAVVSEAEANIYRNEVGDHPGLTVLRHAVDTEYFQPLPDSGSTPAANIVFIGVLNYKPNIEGIAWFVRNVMPLLRQRVPGVNLQIIGRHPSAEVVALGGEANVRVIGSVPDVRDYLRAAVASIAPLQIARGVQTKVLEAMASGRVAVCSRGAAEGIHASHGEHLFICHSPAQWAETLERVIGDAALRRQVGNAARRRIEDVYPWQKCYEPLAEVISGVRLNTTMNKAA